jgi:hypothetical protein
VRVTTALRPGVEIELEMVRDVSLAWVRLPDLTDLDEEELRRARLHAVSEAFLAEGPARMDIDRRVIRPIEAELRRRSLEVDLRCADDVHRRAPAPEAVREAECADDEVRMVSPRQSELRSLDEAGLRRLHTRVMRAVFNANGLRRMGLGTGVLTPIEAEMRRRGLDAEYWSTEHWRRSNAAFRSEQN